MHVMAKRGWEELPVAGAAQAFLTDISHERAPRTVAELELAINSPEHCADQRASGVKSTIHWNDVDDPDHTTFAMLPMGHAGLRVFDVRNPAKPIEIAYFNPGQIRRPDGSIVLDRAANHTRYKDGYIWLSTRAGGFYTLKLEPQVRHRMSA